MDTVSSRAKRVMTVSAYSGLVDWVFGKDSYFKDMVKRDDVQKFVFGNPTEMPIPDFVTALQKSAQPHNTSWFGYKDNEEESRSVLIESLNNKFSIRGLKFEPEDLFLTNGNIFGLYMLSNIFFEEGDEVIYITPCWFFYESYILSHGGKVVRVPAKSDDFDLDIEAIRNAITPKTKAIFINSPNNPTGKIYSPAALTNLSNLLNEKMKENGKIIWLISDEAYQKIVFDNIEYHSPLEYYKYSFMVYTYGKTLLAPGQRIGYVAMNPNIPLELRVQLRPIITRTQIYTGWHFPNAIMQYALPEIENLSVDINKLQQKRDLMISMLSKIGYEIQLKTEGTFYFMVKSPLEDDVEFCKLLSKHKVMALPGTYLEAPGYFRISLTGNFEMIEKSTTGFVAAFKEVKNL